VDATIIMLKLKQKIHSRQKIALEFTVFLISTNSTWNLFSIWHGRNIQKNINSCPL